MEPSEPVADPTAPAPATAAAPATAPEPATVPAPATAPAGPSDQHVVPTPSDTIPGLSADPESEEMAELEQLEADLAAVESAMAGLDGIEPGVHAGAVAAAQVAAIADSIPVIDR